MACPSCFVAASEVEATVEAGVGVSRNTSERGILLCTGRITVGASVTVTFKASAEEPERTIAGVTVRCGENFENPTGLWPCRVEFDDAVDDAVDGAVACLRRADEDRARPGSQGSRGGSHFDRRSLS